MKVVMAANWWYRRGGLGAVMLDEAARLEELGHVVVPFAAAHPGNLPTPWARHFPPFIETQSLGTDRSMMERARMVPRLIYNRDAARRFDALLSEAQPDVVHLHNVARQLSPSILSVARRRGVPVVITLHDYALVCPQGQLYKAEREPCTPPNCLRGNVIHAVTNRCVKRSLTGSLVAAGEHLVHRTIGMYARRARLLVAPSRFLYDVLRQARIPADRLRVLPNGLPDAKPLGPIPMSGGHVLFAGRLAREKGLGVLAAAARLTPEVEYVVAGDGPLLDDLRRSAPDNLRLVGHASPAELDVLRGGAVAIVVPSTWYENAPLAVLEAMRAGRAVVASEIGGHAEMLAHGGGWLVPAGDAGALARASAALWSDRAAAVRIGAEGHASLVARYRLNDHVDRLLGLYEEARRA